VKTEKEKPKRPRGTGSIFQRAGSASFWIQYHRNGRPYRESAHTTKEKQAEKFLQERLAEVCTGNFIGPRIEKIRVSELADDLLLAYKTGTIKGQKSQEWARRRWGLHLAPFLGEFRAVQLGTDLLNRYVQHRQGEAAENATINRELAFLKRAFRLALTASPAKVKHVPAFPHLSENNARQGFLADADYEKLVAGCAQTGLWLRTMLAVGCSFGWRKGEVLGLRVKQVDLAARTIRLEQGTTKNNEGRTVKMTGDVYTLISACVVGKQPEDHVFTREDGKPVLDFRKAWSNACERAGVPDLMFHDLRRTGARNLRRLGVSEGVIMAIGGWKTRTVFDRYNIIDDKDLADAAARLDAKREQQPVTEFSDSSDTVTRSRGSVEAQGNVQ
jgi:integrase